MSDNRVVFTVEIRIVEPPTWDRRKLAALIREALAAKGVNVDGVAIPKWETWDSVAEIAASGEAPEGLSTEEAEQEVSSARWLVREFDGKEGA